MVGSVLVDKAKSILGGVMVILAVCALAILLVIHVYDTDQRLKTVESMIGRIVRDLIVHGSLQCEPEIKADIELLDRFLHTRNKSNPKG